MLNRNWKYGGLRREKLKKNIYGFLQIWSRVTKSKNRTLKLKDSWLQSSHGWKWKKKSVNSRLSSKIDTGENTKQIEQVNLMCNKH